MSDNKFRIIPTRIAKAIAVSLVFSLGAASAKAAEAETSTSETLTEDERKKRDALLEAKSRAQTEKVKNKLPDIGGGNTSKAEADANRKLAESAAAKVATIAQNVAAVSSDTTTNTLTPGVKDQVTKEAANAVLSAGVNAAKTSDNPFLGNLTGNVAMGDQGLDFNLQTIGVLSGQGVGSNWLLQVGGHNEMDRVTGNVGLVYRYVTPDKNALFGANVFYDHDFEAGAHRIGAGVEAATQSTRWFANAYAPLSDSWYDVKDNDDLQERAASGYDLGVTYSPSKLPGLDLSFKGTWWQGERVDVFGTGEVLENPNLWTAKIAYTPIPLVGISLEHEKAVGGPSDTRVMLNFNYKFGQPMSAQTDRRNVAQKNDILSRATAPVERENRIIMEQRDKYAPLAFIGPRAIRATIREDQVYSHMLQLTGGKAPFVFTLSGVNADLFDISGHELRLDPRAKGLVKPKEGEDSLFEVFVNVSDGRGGTAQQAFLVEVTWLDLDEDGLDEDKEKELGTDPNNPDTDGDGINDGQEVTDGTNPLDPNDPGSNNNVPTAVTVLMDGAPFSGAPNVGSTLAANVTCSGNGKCPNTLQYQWEIESAVGSRTYVPIPGATASTYTVLNTDQRRRIRVKISMP